MFGKLFKRIQKSNNKCTNESERRQSRDVIDRDVTDGRKRASSLQRSGNKIWNNASSEINGNEKLSDESNLDNSDLQPNIKSGVKLRRILSLGRRHPHPTPASKIPTNSGVCESKKSSDKELESCKQNQRTVNNSSSETKRRELRSFRADSRDRHFAESVSRGRPRPKQASLEEFLNSIFSENSDVNDSRPRIPEQCNQSDISLPKSIRGVTAVQVHRPWSDDQSSVKTISDNSSLPRPPSSLLAGPVATFSQSSFPLEDDELTPPLPPRSKKFIKPLSKLSPPRLKRRQKSPNLPENPTSRYVNESSKTAMDIGPNCKKEMEGVDRKSVV